MVSRMVGQGWVALYVYSGNEYVSDWLSMCATDNATPDNGGYIQSDCGPATLPVALSVTSNTTH